VKLIRRQYDQVIEDFTCSDAGDYCIGNPGEGIMKNLITLDYSTFLPAIKPKRVYNGLQLDATKRFSNNWQGMASYLYSKLDGNYDGEYAPFTNVGADPQHLGGLRLLRLLHQRLRPDRRSPTPDRCRTTAATSSRSRAST
jgi:hypothetical protein